jgi:histidine triad (HIT) family protein
MSDCIFCKIVEGKIPSIKVYEDEKVIGFKDLRPQSKIHQLFIHKKHTTDISDMSQNASSQLVDLFQAIRLYAEEANLLQEGFRVVTNQGPNAGQTVFHTHFHFLGGEPLGQFGS